MLWKENKILLEIKDLKVDFEVKNQWIEAVKSSNVKVWEGKTTALVGESGSGKSVTMMAAVDLLESNGVVKNGEIYLMEEEIGNFSKKKKRKYLTDNVSMIFQDPFDSLDPLYKVGYQLMEVINIHYKVGKKEGRDMINHILRQMNFDYPEKIVKKYPFQLSGGMCQRIMIAMAMLGKPKVLIADEPTTALDVTVQACILGEIKKFQEKSKMGVLFITHDLSVVAEIADYVFIMKDGYTVESGDVKEVFYNPKHPYTKALISSILD